MNMAIVVAAIGVVAVLVPIVGIATKKMPLVITAMALLGICIIVTGVELYNAQMWQEIAVVAFAVGGLCVCASIIMMIIWWKRK